MALHTYPPDDLPPEEPVVDQPPLSEDEYEAAHGEKLSHTLDLDTWLPGADLVQMYARLEQEIAEAVQQEGEFEERIRREIFPRLRTRPDAPPGAGVYRVSIERLEEIHRKLLFNGAVEACDGTVVTYDTLPVTITQIGVCLVSYRGDQGSWVHRIFRRDLRTTGKNPIDEAMELLERRRRRGVVDRDSARDRLSSLARRGIMAYAERAVLLDRSRAAWRMGHGVPAPYELVTGSGMPELLRAGLDLLKRLILDHKRFVFMPSSPAARELLTIGNALYPFEYAIVDTTRDNLYRIYERGHYRSQEWGDLQNAVEDFVEECGPRIAVGMYRTSSLAPCQVFYAHVDHAHEAALIAMADSVLQEHRGFPMLIDLADGMCRSVFGADMFADSAQAAYAAAGAPFRYLTERSTRR